MKQTYSLRFSLIVLMLLGIGAGMQALALTVTVKMVVNTSTQADTLSNTGAVQVSGESKLGTTPAITWSTSSGIVAQNIGGDYWEATFQAAPGDTIYYKFVTFFDAALTKSTFHWGGWEGPINSGVAGAGENRALIVGNSDTTLDLQYYNGWENKVDQYWRPFESKTDSVAVFFKINMGGAEFDPATQIVDVRGGLPIGNAAWNPAFLVLTRDANSVNNGSFWRGVVYVAKSAITVSTSKQEFKYVIQPSTWESTGNRSFIFSSLSDTTIEWKYFNDFPPQGPKVTADVLFSLKLQALENSGMFNRAIGDKIAVTGAKGWPPSDFNPLTDFDTTSTMLKMTYDPDLKEWDLVESFTKYPNEVLKYKYYIAWDSSRVDSASANYIPGLQLSDGWEEPGVTGGADRSYKYTSDVQQVVPGDFGSETQFFNSLHWKSAITTPIQVTFNINMAPATNSATNPNTLFVPGTDTLYVQFDGCLTAVTQGMTMWGTDNRLMLSDVDGDGIYTGTWNLKAPSLNQFCYRLVYTSSGIDGGIENGSGSAVQGRRYYQYVHPLTVTADGATWPATYSLTEMPWMLDNLTIEDPPDMNTITGVGDNNSNIVTSFELKQNYPNPFNPTTVITYAVPQNGHVSIDVFNVLGQKVSTLVNQEQIAGTHSISWNAAESGLSSGMYMYRMQAGTFSQVKKMLLTK
jgi:hypothetical protein